MNRVPMARHGLILRENEAMGSRKVSKYLLGLQDTILSPKLIDKVPKSQKSPNPVNYVYSDIWGRRHGRSPFYYFCLLPQMALGGPGWLKTTLLRRGNLLHTRGNHPQFF